MEARRKHKEREGEREEKIAVVFLGERNLKSRRGENMMGITVTLTGENFSQSEPEKGQRKRIKRTRERKLKDRMTHPTDGTSCAPLLFHVLPNISLLWLLFWLPLSLSLALSFTSHSSLLPLLSMGYWIRDWNMNSEKRGEHQQLTWMIRGSKESRSDYYICWYPFTSLVFHGKNLTRLPPSLSYSSPSFSFLLVSPSLSWVITLLFLCIIIQKISSSSL